MPREVRYCRPKSQPPDTLLSFLATKFTYLSAEAWTHHLREGHVFVNGAPHRTGDRVLEQGDMLRFAPPRSLEPRVDETSICVLYDDASLVVCAKNGNLPVAEGGRYCENTLVGVLQRQGVAAFYTADTVTCGHGSTLVPVGPSPILVRSEGEMKTASDHHSELKSSGKRPHESASSVLPDSSVVSLKSMSPVTPDGALFTVQRLDKETSGVLVLCKQPSTARSIASQLEGQTRRCTAAVEAHLQSSHSATFTETDFESILEQCGKTVRKTYTAVLCGAAPVGKTYVVVNYMDAMQSHPDFARDPAHSQLKRLKMCCVPLLAVRDETGSVPPAQWGKVACTRVRVLASSASLGLSCVEVTLLTGRSHQIRVHCASLGYPVLGDKLYTAITPGVDNGCAAVSDTVYLARVREEENPHVEVENGALVGHRMQCRRHLLHATELCFEHPNLPGAAVKPFIASPVDFFVRDVRFDAPEDAVGFDALLRGAFGHYGGM